MDVHPKCAGLDVHLKTVLACVRIGSGKTVTYEVRTFGTTTPELLALSDWLSAHDCTHVAMESSGVYRKPVWHVLEGHFEPPHTIGFATVPTTATSAPITSTNATRPSWPSASSPGFDLGLVIDVRAA